jgi:hypothetical protein
MKQTSERITAYLSKGRFMNCEHESAVCCDSILSIV